MNLFEWKHHKAQEMRQNAKNALRECVDVGPVIESFPNITDWEQIAEELDAEQYLEPLDITEATEVAGYEQVSETVYEYSDFVPGEGPSYTVSFIAHSAFINENAGLVAKMQERMGASEFVVEKVGDGISMVCFMEATGTPVTRRTHRISESPMTLWSIAPTPTEKDIKRAAIRERIWS